jgi:hypothetical protein
VLPGHGGEGGGELEGSRREEAGRARAASSAVKQSKASPGLPSKSHVWRDLPRR